MTQPKPGRLLEYSGARRLSPVGERTVQCVTIRLSKESRDANPPGQPCCRRRDLAVPAVIAVIVVCRRELAVTAVITVIAAAAVVTPP